MLSRLPDVGLGVPGRADMAESPNKDAPPLALGEPNEDLRPFWNALLGENGDPLPLLARALGNRGLLEIGEPEKLLLRLESLPLAPALPRVAVAMLAGEPDTEGVRAYRGGVVYTALGVAAALRGSRPRSLRWLGVRGISTRLSVVRKSGSTERTMLIANTALRIRATRLPYRGGMTE